MSFYHRDEVRKLGFMSVGEGVQISTKASFYGLPRIAIGAFSRIDDFCVLSAGDGGIFIGRNVHIGVLSSLIGQGKINLNDFVNISSRVAIYSSNDDYSGNYMTGPTLPEQYTNIDKRDVELGRHVIVGSGTVILPGVKIGAGVAIGALSLINKDLEAFGIYAGAPLKRLGSRNRKLIDLEKQYLDEAANRIP